MTKRTPEEAEIVLPQQVVFVVKKEEGAQAAGRPGSRPTRTRRSTTSRVHRDGTWTRKRNFWMSQEGKHIPYQDPVSSIDPKVPIMVHFN